MGIEPCECLTHGGVSQWRERALPKSHLRHSHDVGQRYPQRDQQWKQPSGWYQDGEAVDSKFVVSASAALKKLGISKMLACQPK